MSSAAESMKQPASEAAADEPSPKKAKVSESDIKSVEANNGVSTSEKGGGSIENNNGGGGTSSGTANDKSSTAGSKVPSKAVNGNDKESKHNENDDVDDDDDDDDDDDEKYDGGEIGNMEGVFDPKIAKSLEQVETIQSEICNLNEKASEEILKVEQKFNKLRRPHFEKRNELLKEIPNFWLTSLANHPMITPMIESAADEGCLNYMVNLDVEEFEDIKSGYKLKLQFVENPYITNQEIVKEFQIVSSEDVLSSSTPIEYKHTDQGNSLKQVVENSIAQYKRSRRALYPGPRQTQQSFFAWLVEPSKSGTDEIAEILKDQIWPNPLEFFFATPDEYGGASDDESDDEDEEIDDEEIDDEEDGVITEGLEEYSDDEIEGEEADDDDDDDDDDDEEDVE